MPEFHRFDTLGAGGGGLASFGYDWRLQANSLIVGIVGDIGFLHDPGGQVFRTTTNLTGSGGVRLGFAASPALLLYGQSGIAFANEFVAIDLGGPTTQQNRFTPGIAVGAGGEYVIRSRPSRADRRKPYRCSPSFNTSGGLPTRSICRRRRRHSISNGGARELRRSWRAGPFLIDAATAGRRAHCRIAIVLPGPRSGTRPISTSRSTAMQPAVGEKSGRAMCRKMALPALGTTGSML